MTWVAVIFTPIVLVYQGWTYWVFRKRIGVASTSRNTDEPAGAGRGAGARGSHRPRGVFRPPPARLRRRRSSDRGNDP